MILVGGALFSHFALRGQWPPGTGLRFRPWALGAGAAILASGLYNFLQKTAVPKPYHMVFGIKFLLALHVIAVVVLACRADSAKQSRLLTGAAVSGFVIVLLSGYLRSLSQ